MSFVTRYFLDRSVFTLNFLYFLTASAAKDILLDCVLKNHMWGVLDLYVVLTDDMVKFDMEARKETAYLTEDPLSPKFKHIYHTEALLKILREKCSVSDYIQ